MKPKQLYRSDDGAFTMLAEDISMLTALHEVRSAWDSRRATTRRLVLRAGELEIGRVVVIGDVASELFRIEQTLAASLNAIADERFTAVLSTVPVERSPHP
jgi:hypothetical protein